MVFIVVYFFVFGVGMFYILWMMNKWVDMFKFGLKDGFIWIVKLFL